MMENFVQEIQSNSPELEDIGDGLDDADAFCLACADEPEIIPDSHSTISRNQNPTKNN